MKRPLRMSAFVIITLLLMMTVFLISPQSQVQARALSYGCFGNGCTGQDPVAMGCSDSTAYVVQTQTIYGSTGNILGYVQLKYSGGCGTNWAKVYTANGQANTISGRVQRDDGVQECWPTTCGQTTWQSGIYTDMVYAPTGVRTARACGLIDIWEWCTTYH